jgi:acetyl esterase
MRNGLPFTLITLLVATLTFGEAPVPDHPAAGAQPDPQMTEVLDTLAGLGGKPIEMLEPDQARKQPTPTDAVVAVLKKQGKSTDPEPVGDVDNRTIEAPDGRNIATRIYAPTGAGPFPVVVYYHGGGFVIATLDTYDASCRALCVATGAVVVSVDYRQAPESKYPAAVDDAFAAYQWVRANADKIKGDPNRVAVAGESAGGNLAAVVSIIAKEKNAPMPVFQLLIYPVVDNNMGTESYKENANAKPLNRAMMTWFFGHYLADAKSADDPHVLPMKAKDLSGLPPAMVLTAQIDPLRSEGKAYAGRLKNAGVPVEYKNYDGVAHEFFGMGAVVDTAKVAQVDAAEALKKAFSQKATAKKE